MWLRDFLPKSIPEARVLTLGYNSAVAFAGSASGLDDYATTLLNRLLQIRRKDDDATVSAAWLMIILH